jgi:phenylpropionate dioxygenase-like ring-hydroxylating dioxygenase large terminal subunit
MRSLQLPPFPSGWYQVAFGSEVPPGTVIPLHYFGRELLCYRGANGEPHVMDAHCPHLGAHIGYGGRVDGDDLVCPFHEWRFDCAGRNVDIPYRDRVNRGARLGSWPTREIGDAVFCWYGQHPTAEPTWQLPSIPELEDEAFVWYVPPDGRYEIASHPQEILENSVDIAHFRYVHGIEGFGAVEMVEDGAMFRADASVTFNTSRGPVEGAVQSELWGLGLDVVRPRALIQAVGLLTLTPVDEGVVDARYSFLLPHEDGEVTNAGHSLAREFQRQIQQDIQIWEHKTYHEQPRLAAGEAAIMDFRRWAEQFYD